MAKEKTFRTKNGDLTVYALACGYVQNFDNVELSKEHNVYHVKGVYSNNEKFWECFDRIEDAKNFIKNVLKTKKG